MKSVWKFPLKFKVTSLEMPSGARILKANIQNNDVMLWAEVNPEAPREQRNFGVFGTGHEIPETAIYRSTFFHDLFVWHVYELAVSKDSTNL